MKIKKHHLSIKHLSGKKSLLFCFLFCLFGSMNAQENFEEMVDGLISKSVPLISVEELSLALKDNPDLILLDAREKSEYKVSHLENANYVGFDLFKKKSVAELPKDKKVVVYCTVGYRSEVIAAKLQKLGFTDVHNLYGGICDWVNKEQPIVDPEGNATQKVHTYDESWGQWFQKGDKVH